MQSPPLRTAKDLLLHVADEANMIIGISYQKSRTIFTNIEIVGFNLLELHTQGKED